MPVPHAQRDCAKPAFPGSRLPPTAASSLRGPTKRRYAETGSYTIDRGQCQIMFSDTQPDSGYEALPEGLAYGAMKSDYDRSSYAHVGGGSSACTSSCALPTTT